jgi:hypothetical protein
MKYFAVTRDTYHHVGDGRCPECAEGYPGRCPCGGYIHASPGDLDLDDTALLVTACDVCGRSENALEEDLAR